MSVEIRHSEQKDIEAIKNLYAQESCYAQTLQAPYPSLDKWQQFLASPKDNFHSLVAVNSDNAQIVGQLGIEVFSSPRRKHVANFGMAVDEQARGKGIGDALVSAAITLACNWLAVRRIELEVYTDNAKAIALYQKHGFEIEGTSKGYAFRNGQYVDVHLMAKVVE